MLDFLKLVIFGALGLGGLFIVAVLIAMSSGEGGIGRFFSSPEQDRMAAEEKVRVEQSAISKAKALAQQHLPALIRQRRLLITKDAYGVENSAKWDVELDHFMRSVVEPALALEAERTFYLPQERARVHALCEVEVRLAIDRGLDAANSAFRSEYDPSMSPIDFEHFCAERLRLDGWKADVTKASADQGADIIARFERSSLAIQCKQYSKPVGNGAVQEVVAARAHYGADHAAVIANIGFTPAAQKLAETNNVHLVYHDDIGELAKLGPKANKGQLPV